MISKKIKKHVVNSHNMVISNQKETSFDLQERFYVFTTN